MHLYKLKSANRCVLINWCLTLKDETPISCTEMSFAISLLCVTSKRAKLSELKLFCKRNMYVITGSSIIWKINCAGVLSECLSRYSLRSDVTLAESCNFLSVLPKTISWHLTGHNTTDAEQRWETVAILPCTDTGANSKFCQLKLVTGM